MKPTEGKGVKREIKFRVWEYEAKEFLYLNPMFGGLFDSRWFIDDEQSVIMEFTGMLDKNGKDIYEGDIVSIMRQGTKFIGEVKWGSGGFFIYTKQLPNLFNFSKIHDEVIGNIYQNKELL